MWRLESGHFIGWETPPARRDAMLGCESLTAQTGETSMNDAPKTDTGTLSVDPATTPNGEFFRSEPEAIGDSGDDTATGSAPVSGA